MEPSLTQIHVEIQNAAMQVIANSRGKVTLLDDPAVQDLICKMIDDIDVLIAEHIHSQSKAHSSFQEYLIGKHYIGRAKEHPLFVSMAQEVQIQYSQLLKFTRQKGMKPYKTVVEMVKIADDIIHGLRLVDPHSAMILEERFINGKTLRDLGKFLGCGKDRAKEEVEAAILAVNQYGLRSLRL